MRLLIKRILTTPLVILVAIYLFLEQVTWEWLKPHVERLAALPAVARLEAWVARQPTWMVLLLVVVVNANMPLKLYVLWLLSTGWWLILGAVLYVVIELISTALTVWIFLLAKPRLMEVRWFAWIYNTVTSVREYVFVYVQSLPLWHTLQRLIVQVRTSMRSHSAGLLVARFRAICRKMRRRRSA